MLLTHNQKANIMQTFTYWATSDPNQTSTVILTFPDVEGAIAEGEDLAALIKDAQTVLALMLGEYIQQHKQPPPVTYKDGTKIELPIMTRLKLELAIAFANSDLTQAALGKLMGISQQQVNRILDVGYNTKFEAIAQAFHHLEFRLDINLNPI